MNDFIYIETRCLVIISSSNHTCFSIRLARRLLVSRDFPSPTMKVTVKDIPFPVKAWPYPRWDVKSSRCARIMVKMYEDHLREQEEKERQKKKNELWVADLKRRLRERAELKRRSGREIDSGERPPVLQLSRHEVFPPMQ